MNVWVADKTVWSLVNTCQRERFRDDYRTHCKAPYKCPVYFTSKQVNWSEKGLTSHWTHYRSFRGRFLRVKWPNQQCQSTEGSSGPKDRLQSHQVHVTVLQTYTCKQYTIIHIIHAKMNLSTVKWVQWDKTQSRELLVCSYVCASHCAQLLHTILHRTDLIVSPLTLQTITTAPMMSIWGKGVPSKQVSPSAPFKRTFSKSFLTSRRAQTKTSSVRERTVHDSDVMSTQVCRQIVSNSWRIDTETSSTV